MSQQTPDTHGMATFAPGTVLGGKFRVVRLLGAGGMGAVYEIEHEITKHRRALKMLHGEVQRYPGVVARFLREASAAGRVGNKHIIETFDAGTLDTGDPYLVMEMLSGETLADILTRKVQLGLIEMIDLLGQACDGVQAAHDAGIVHRDLKPENLFVIQRDGLPFVKILDFGVSKFDPATTGNMALTSEGSAVGTPFYMPPEQVRGGKDIDARADVYALGVILYECAMGRKPFEAETLPHLALLIHEGKYEPVASRRPDLPTAFADVVACAMAGDRDARFPSARSLRDALTLLKPAATTGVSGASMLGATTPAMEAPVASFRPVTSAPALTPPVPSRDSGRRGSVTNVAVTLGVTASHPGQPAPQPPQPKKSGAPLAGIVVAVLAVAAGGAFFALRPKPTPQVDVNAAQTASAATSASPQPSSDDPTVTPVTSAPPPSQTAPPMAPPPSAPPSAGKPGRPPPVAGTPPTPPPTPPTTPNTRADQKGLAKDNPFK